MPTLWLDLETASTVPIKAGSYRYSEGARILVQACAVDEGPPVAEPFDAAVLQLLIDNADVVVAHNGGLFDRVQLARHGVTIPVEKLHDTMAIAYQHSLPGSLDALAGVFQLETSKDKDGKRLIRLFCVPNKKGTFATPETHPEDWRKFLDYAKTDIEVMRQLYKKLRKWNLTPFERRVWTADQAVNDRGLGVDVELARAAITAVDAAQEHLAERASDLTLVVVGSATQRDALLSYLNAAYDLGLEDLKGSTVEKALQRDDLPAELRELLVVRAQASTTSTAKYRALLDCVSADGRLRGLKQYCGASRTGRWAGRLWQPDNLPRSSIGKLKGEALQEAIETGIEALKLGCADLLFDDVMELTSAALRGLIVPREGRKLAVADLNAIEGRVLAWLAGEQWKLDAYARGEDLYKVTAGRILGKRPEDIDDDERQQVGKVSELALGFQGGPGAFVTFATAYNIDIDKLADRARQTLPRAIVEDGAKGWDWALEQERDTRGLSRETWIGIDAIKRAWRAAHPRIARFWGDLEAAARGAIENSGARFHAGRVEFIRQDAWLRMVLPSGRSLCYPGPTISYSDVKRSRLDNARGAVAAFYKPDGMSDKAFELALERASRPRPGGVTFMGVDQFTRKFQRTLTYGGKLAENATQAVARDILAHGLVLAEERGFEPVMHVHDEIIAENCTAAELSEVMSIVPDWAEGLPLAAKGFDCARYRK
jgi:DNA polymerase